MHFGMKLYNVQLNTQVFKFILFICLHLPYMFWQAYNFGSGSSHLGMVSVPRRLESLLKLYTCL
jgi:hypothetical protein